MIAAGYGDIGLTGSDSCEDYLAIAGDIAQEKYQAKHAQFMAQKAELEAEQDKVSSSVAQGLEQRLVILELAQKAAAIYQTRTPEQKRLIITKLFANITAYDGSVSVTLTNFSRAIAERALKTSNLMEGAI